MIIDTHCHLDFPDFNQDRNEVLKRAKEAGVGAIINIGTSVETSMLSYKLAKEETDIYTSLGIHPHHADEVNGKIPEELKGLCKDKKIVAIGEVGLDYYRNLSSKKMQKALFLDSIELALQEDLPLVIHTRDAHKDMLGILKSYNSTFKGVMHCFSGDEGFLKDSIEMGFYISFTCNLTFKNANKLRTLAKKVPPERLLLETDAPFLAPQEYRGKRNEPAYLKSLVEAHSKIHGLSCDDIERITTHNAICLFGLPYKEEGKIAYPIRDSLYINITNECTNDCSFCVKRSTDFVKGHNLKLGKEPDIDEIMDAAKGYPGYKKIVFCGYGEPTLRLDLLKKAAKRFKDMGFHTRLATNGEGNLK